MAAHSILLGIVFMVLAGLAVTAEMVFSMTMLQMQWPYWRITAISCFGCAAPICIFLLAFRGTDTLSATQFKWVLLQGMFAAAYWGLAIVAAQIGVDPGDVAALTSINIIAAAVLGRFCLREEFRFLHLVAVTFSVVGAVLVAQPAFLFATSRSARGPWYGYVAAISSGFLQGCFFICSRKAGEVAAAQLTLSALMFSGVMCALLPFTRLVEEAPFSIALSLPWEGLGWTVVAFGTTMGSAFFSCAGSMLCPAAISATVYTAASMLFGYVAQTIFFGSKPELLTVIGACLMLTAVSLMAFAGRTVAPKLDIGDGDAQRPKSEQTLESRSPPSDDDTESLTSFAASEFSDFAANRDSLRFRGQANQRNAMPAEQVGASS